MNIFEGARRVMYATMALYSIIVSALLWPMEWKPRI